MVPTRVVFYREPSGRVPMQRWLDELPEQHRKRCLVMINRLQELGHKLRLPHTRELRDDIYELRTRVGTVRYRILYFWHGGTAAVVSHGIAKKTHTVPQRDMQRALKRKRQFEQNPTLHTEEIDNG